MNIDEFRAKDTSEKLLEVAIRLETYHEDCTKRVEKLEGQVDWCRNAIWLAMGGIALLGIDSVVSLLTMLISRSP